MSRMKRSIVFCLVVLALTVTRTLGNVQPMGPQACVDGGSSTSCSANRKGDFASLQLCMYASFPECDKTLVTVDSLPKCTYFYDGDSYALARASSHGDMLPYAVIYIESEEEAVEALECAVDNGFRVSARGRGHDYQGLSSYHGNVVIDMSLTCKPDEFVIDRTGGDHILPGQRYLATIQVQPGCTNAVMLAAAYKNFTAEEGALALIGSCPSVGITGFLLGGGSGDVTPYTGWMVDLLQEARVILYNGTVVTASEEENPELFWSLRGGGSGNGIVSSLTLRIVQAPEPTKADESRKTTYVEVVFDGGDPDKRLEIIQAVQNFFYDVHPSVSSKFGGTAGFSRDLNFLSGFYLGSFEEFVEAFYETGLFDENFFYPLTSTDIINSTLYRYDAFGDLNVVCGEQSSPCQIANFPAKHVRAYESDSYPRLMAYKICNFWEEFVYNPLAIRSTNDFCADLEIDRIHCSSAPLEEHIAQTNTFVTAFVERGFIEVDPTENFWYPRCDDKEVIDAILEKAGDPESFLNRHGPSPYWLSLVTTPPPYPAGIYPNGIAAYFDPTQEGSAMLPELELETLLALSNSDNGVKSTHLQHGAPMTIPVNATALGARRDAAMMIEFHDPAPKAEFLDILVHDPEYNGDSSRLQGYYNYLGPYTPNWRTLYFGDHYEMLRQIRCANDPVDVFGKPLTVELCQEGHATDVSAA